VTRNDWRNKYHLEERKSRREAGFRIQEPEVRGYKSEIRSKKSGARKAQFSLVE
jgi:hypothetical protein